MTRRRTLRRINATEADTLRVICDWLDVQQRMGKLLYIRHSPSNIVGKKGEARFRRPRESQLGAPDVIIFQLANGRPDVLCIEVKSASGKQSKEQKKWQEMAEAMGMRYILARSLDDVINATK